jgi:hypothetical protein
VKRLFRVFTAVLLAGLFILFSGACGLTDNDSNSGPNIPFIVAELVNFPAGSEPAGFNSGATVAIKETNTGIIITNATVMMSGISLPFSTSEQQYIGDVIVLSGQTVTLSVTVGVGTYTAMSNQFTTYPAISSPMSGSMLFANAAIPVLWSGGTPAASIVGYGIGILNANDPNGPLVWPANGLLRKVSPTLFSVDVPAGSLVAGSYLVLACVAGNSVTVQNATVDSVLSLIGCSHVPITVQ